MKREQGFTMIELMIVIIVGSILLGLALYGFTDWRLRYRLRGAAQGLFSDLQLAKMTAVKDRERCGILFDVGGGRYQVVGCGENATCGDGDDVILKTVSLSQYGRGVCYGFGPATGAADASGFDNNVSFPGDGVVFDPRGIVVTPTGAIFTGGFAYLQDRNTGSKNSFAVGVTTGGGITLRRWTGSAWE